MNGLSTMQNVYNAVYYAIAKTNVLNTMAFFNNSKSKENMKYEIRNNRMILFKYQDAQHQAYGYDFDTIFHLANRTVLCNIRYAKRVSAREFRDILSIQSTFPV